VVLWTKQKGAGENLRPFAFRKTIHPLMLTGVAQLQPGPLTWAPSATTSMASARGPLPE
jgi:hypothetical protein